MDDQGYLQLAIDEAVAGVRAGDGRPFGAVFVRAGTTVVKAHNSVILRNDGARRDGFAAWVERVGRTQS